MLKRYQIILNDWMEDHYKNVAKKYDVSFSEMIRMALCVDIITATQKIFPKYKVDIDLKQLKKMMKKQELVGSLQLEEFHRFLSKLYFESRKASEFLNGKLNKITR